MVASADAVGTVARTYPSLSYVRPSTEPLTASNCLATCSVAPGAVETIMVMFFSPLASALARTSASAVPSLSAGASLAAALTGAVAGSSAAKTGAAPVAASAATSPAAAATRATRLAPGM